MGKKIKLKRTNNRFLQEDTDRLPVGWRKDNAEASLKK